jgi:hypothetical protein
MDEVEIVVLFRNWRGELIALFPTEPAQVQTGACCVSYMHVGQHGAANPDMIIRESKPATPEQYNALKLELERAGYVVKVEASYTQAMARERYENWRRFRGL